MKIKINNIEKLKGMICRLKFMQFDPILRTERIEDVESLMGGWNITVYRSPNEVIYLYVIPTVEEGEWVRILRRWEFDTVVYQHEGRVGVKDMGSAEDFLKAVEWMGWQ